MDYRILSFLALLCWGAWGFLCKILTRDMTTGVLVLWTNVGGLLPILFYILSQHSFRWEKHGELALLAGLFGSAATVFFYLALKNGPASVVVPFSGMYILIPALLGVIFLREPVTVRHLAGLVCAGAAIFFLSR